MGLFDSVGDFFDDAGGSVSDFFSGLGGNVSSAFEDAFSFLGDAGGDFADAFGNFVGPIPADAARFIGGGVNTAGLTGLGGGFFTNDSGQILRMPDPSNPTSLISVINPLALIQPGNPSNLLTSNPQVASAIENITGPATSLIGDAASGVADVGQDVIGGIGDVGQDLLGGLGGAGLNPLTALLTGVGPLANLPGGLFGTALSGGAGAFNDLLGGIPGFGDLGSGGDIEGAIRQSSEELRDAINEASPIERAAIMRASQAQREGLEGSLRQGVEGLATGRDVLRDTSANLETRLGPSAGLGTQALLDLSRQGATPANLSAGQTFTPGTAPLNFGADPRSGLAFDQPIATGETFGRGPNLDRQFTAPTDTGLTFDQPTRFGMFGAPTASGKTFNPETAFDQFTAPTSRGQGFEFTTEDLANDPGFQFRLEQGQQAVDRSAAARGGLVSGRTLAASQEFGQGLAATELDRAFGRQLAGFQANEQAFANEFQRSAQQFGINADEFARKFGREDAVFTRNEQQFADQFRRQAQQFGLNADEFAQQFSRGAQQFQLGEQQFANRFGRQADQFDTNADIFNADFQRELQGFGARETAFGQEFGRGAATFDRNAQEFGQTFARQASSFDRNQEANELANRRQFDAFRANEDNAVRRDALHLQDVQRRQSALSQAAGLGGGARNLLAQLDASLSQNLSTAEAAPLLAEAANILQQAQVDNEEFLALGFSEADQQRVGGNVQASEENAIAMARAQMQAQVTALLGAVIGSAGALFGGGTAPPAAPAPNLPPVSTTFGVNQPQRGPTLSLPPSGVSAPSGGGLFGSLNPGLFDF